MDSRDGAGSAGMSGRVYGTDADGREVTASFGQAGTPHEGHAYIAFGHSVGESFWRHGHDHYGPGNGPNDNGTERGYYNS